MKPVEPPKELYVAFDYIPGFPPVQVVWGSKNLPAVELVLKKDLEERKRVGYIKRYRRVEED